MKTCSKCGMPKEEKEFAARPDRPGRLFSRCRPCEKARKRQWQLDHPEIKREANGRWLRANPTQAKLSSREWARRNWGYFLRKYYDLSIAEYEQMLEAQGGVCAICKQADLRKRLSVDHDHTTGKVRGLLCNTCNRALGLLKDSIPVMTAATDYLKSWV